MNAPIKDFLLWTLSQVAAFNRREFHAIHSTAKLTQYRRAEKPEKYNKLLALITGAPEHEQLRLIDAWRLLLASERLYEDALILTGFVLETPEETHPHTIDANKSKKFQLKSLQFGRGTRTPKEKKKKNASLEEAVAVLIAEFDSILDEHLRTFATHCKRYALLDTREDAPSVHYVTMVNKKFHDNLSTQCKHLQGTLAGLTERVDEQEFQAELLIKIAHTRKKDALELELSHLLDEWSVFRLITGTLANIMQDVCKELKLLLPTGGRGKRSFFGKQLKSFDSLQDYMPFERSVHQLLVDSLGEIIVQLRIGATHTQRYDPIVDVLKECLTSFRDRLPSKHYSFVEDEKDFLYFGHRTQYSMETLDEIVKNDGDLNSNSKRNSL